MPILTGSASLTRCTVLSGPNPPDFDTAPFVALAEGSEVCESIGFLPFEPGAEYQVAHDRWAFRVRFDQLRPDPTAVRERLADLVRVEREQSGGFVGAKKRKELRHLAEEELLVEARPRSQIFECVLDGRILHLGTTANAHIGRILLLLRKAGVIVEFKTPWSDHGDPAIESDLLQITDPSQSLHGSRFLQWLLEDQELVLEPVDGYVKLQIRDARITATGRILGEIHRHLDDDCELLAAKLAAAETSFRLDALAFRVSGVRLERSRSGHWIERLDERLEQIGAVWDLLDRKYAESRKSQRRGSTRRRAIASAAGSGGGEVVPIR